MSKKYTVIELRKICKSKGIKGYSKLKKAELMKHCLKSISKKPKSISKKPKKIVKKKKSLPKRKKRVLPSFVKRANKRSSHTVLDKDVLGIITGYAKEDEITKYRRKQIKEAKNKLDKLLKNKRDFDKEIKENNYKIAVYILKKKNGKLSQEEEIIHHKLYNAGIKIESDRSKYIREKSKYQALLKTGKQLQKASIKELKGWAKIMKVPVKLTKTKKSKILSAINKVVDELNI